MPIVPYSRQVKTDTARIPETPSVDNRVVLSAINQRGADNQRTAQAVEDIGQQVQKHAAKLQLLQNEQHASRLDTDFRKSLQNKLYSPETEAIDIDGNTIERPSGILNRQLGQATGSTTDLDAWYQTEKENYLSQVNDPNYRLALEKSLESSFYTSRDNVLKHEAKQMRSDMVNTFQSELTQKIKDSAEAQTPETLQLAVNDVTNAQRKINLAADADPATSALNIGKSVAATVDTAVVNKLRSTGDIGQANELLYSMEKSIDLESFNAIQKKLETGYTAMTAARTRIDNIKKNDNALDMLSGITSGEINWTNLHKIDDANVPDEFKIAAKEAVDAQIKNIKRGTMQTGKRLTAADAQAPGEELDSKQKYFARQIADVLNSGDKDTIVSTMSSALRNYGKGQISQENMNILVRLAVARGANLPIKQDVENGVEPDAKQVEFTAGAKSILDWQNKSQINGAQAYGDYIKGIQSGMTTKEAHDMAIKNAVIKEFPQAATMETPPNMIIDSNSGIRVIFPNTSENVAKRVWDPAKKAFVPNKKYDPYAKPTEKKPTGNDSK